MMKRLVVAAMHRTGHHAISVWLLHQQKEIHEFSINTITPWLFEVQNSYGISLLANNPFKKEEHPDKEKFDEIIHNTNPHFLIITHEQEKLSQAAWACGHSSAMRGDEKPKIVVVLRDFKNWAASCIKMAERDNPVDSIGYMADYIDDDKVAVYHNHCQLFNNPDVTYILYDRWVEEEGYRREICEQLGLHFTDSAFNQLSIFGKGSSFDGMRHIKTASLMQVNQRYKQMEDHPTYKQVINDNPEVLLASDEIFGRYQ